MRYTIEWFKNEANKHPKYYDLYKNRYHFFQKLFSPSELSKMKPEEILDKIFLNGKKKDMCYLMEYSDKYEPFGSIWGGSAYKYPLHIEKDTGRWATGTSKSPIYLKIDEACFKAKRVIDALVHICNCVNEIRIFDSTDKYLELWEKIKLDTSEFNVNNIWYVKYLHLIYPEIFPIYYSERWLKKVLFYLGIKPLKTRFEKIGQIQLFTKQTGLQTITFDKIMDKVIEHEEIIANSNIVVNKNELPDELLKIKNEIDAIDTNNPDYDNEIKKILERNINNINLKAKTKNLQVKSIDDLLNRLSLLEQINKPTKKRDPIIIERVKKHSKYLDEITKRPSFVGKDGRNYIEVHHIIEFGKENGPDVSYNLICLSPEHHAIMHHGSITEVRKLYKMARENKAITVDRFKDMIIKYRCLNKKHIDILLEKNIVTSVESAELLSLIDECDKVINQN